MLVLGTLVYNEILVIPIGFMKRNTRKEIEKRELGNGMARPGTEYSEAGAYMSAAPHALYRQSERNERIIQTTRASQRASLMSKHDHINDLSSKDTSVDQR